MDRITFLVNGDKYSVGSEVDSDTSLNDFLRNKLNARGTKFMCKEGVCGSCIVAVKAPQHDGTYRTFSVNSCLVSITSCQDWEIMTVEGIGNRQGYHPIQRTLAEQNGTQCGYCSPGFVMSMYSLLESGKHLTEYEIEKSFGSNTCRCTGYRPILEAFKTFASDAKAKAVGDIEDMKLCKNKDNCESDCGDWCVLAKRDDSNKKIHLKDDHVWCRVHEIKDIFDILAVEGTDSYMLINGNTGKGAVPIFEYPRVLIDISPVDQLKSFYVDQNLVIGAGTSLTETMQIFEHIAQERPEFAYLQKFYEHLDLVAHIPVRNIGSIAGNLMLKHRQLTFTSDVFLLFETVGAMLSIHSESSLIEVSPEQFLSLDMTGRIITSIKFPPLSTNYKFVSFKIMPRSQNSYAQVNAGFLYEFHPHNYETVISARLVFGGISTKFVHAQRTEQFLIDKKIFTNEVLQEALKELNKEIVAVPIRAYMKPEFRKKLALSLFYKGLLNLIPVSKLKSRYLSGARDFRKTRAVSKGTEVYDTNPIIWPLNEPMPKVEALIQTAGEAKYVNDLPTQPNEVFCAFVTSDVHSGDIESIDPSNALKVPGVLAFFEAKDIPGVNSYVGSTILGFLPEEVIASKKKVPGVLAFFEAKDIPGVNSYVGSTILGFLPEEVIASKKVNYHGQPVGIIVAETDILANRAALLVKVKYRTKNSMPILTIRDAMANDPSRVFLFFVIPARDRGSDVQRVIKGFENIYWQYHYTMETQSCVTIPNEDGLEVYSASQFPDLAHVGIAQVLNLEQNQINLTVPRCGGAYGCKISKAGHIAAACSLVAYLLNKPCRFVMTAQASLRVIGKREPCSFDFEVGVNDNGEIQYLEYHLYEDIGYKIVDLLGPFLIPSSKNCYDSRRWQFKFFTVFTDTPANTYARSPGSFETIAMAEHVMEQIAYALNKDPVEVRQNNLYAEYTDVAEVIQTLIEDSEYYKRKEDIQKFNRLNRWKKRVLRASFMSWPTSILMNFSVLMSVYQGDGTVVVKHGGIEMGQGINTKIIQAVAYTLKIPIRKVKVKSTDVISSPNSFATGTSRTTQAICFAAIKCCQLLLDRLTPVRESLKDPTWEVLVQAAYLQGISLQVSYQATANDQINHRSAGAALAEVEVDILTGEIDIRRVDIVEDVGTSINPEIDIGQIEGAFVYGLGYWTVEHQIYNKHTGELETDRTWDYHVPLAKDIPIDFRIKLRRNSYNPLGTLGARAVAEPATTLAVCVAFAIREAIASSREETGFPKNKWFDVGKLSSS